MQVAESKERVLDLGDRSSNAVRPRVPPASPLGSEDLGSCQVHKGDRKASEVSEAFKSTHVLDQSILYETLSDQLPAFY
jgi:hypothetical protein